MSDNWETSVQCLAVGMSPAPNWALFALHGSDGNFRCPYYWHDHTTFSECASVRLKGHARLSEHIREQHLESHFYCRKCGHGSGSKRYQKRHSRKACNKILKARSEEACGSVQSGIVRMIDFTAISWDMVGSGHHARSDLMNDLDTLLFRLMGRCSLFHDCCPKMRLCPTTLMCFGAKHVPPLHIVATADSDGMDQLSLDESSQNTFSPTTLPNNFAPLPNFVVSANQIYAELMFSEYSDDMAVERPVLPDTPSLTWKGATLGDSTNTSFAEAGQAQDVLPGGGLPAGEPAELCYAGSWNMMDLDVEEGSLAVGYSGSTNTVLAELTPADGKMEDFPSGRPSVLSEVRQFDAVFALHEQAKNSKISKIDTQLQFHSLY